MNRQKIAQIIVAVGFFALLGGIYAMDLKSGSSSDKSFDKETALQRYGFYLQEVSEESGVEFTHQAPKLDSKLDHIMPQVASVGASVSVVDFNNDGWQDFYLTNSRQGSANALYKNLGNGTFKDVAKKLGIADLNTQNKGAAGLAFRK